MIGESTGRIIKKKKRTDREIASDVGIDHANLHCSLKNGANPEWMTIEKFLSYLGDEIRIARSEKKIKWEVT